jgi:hypothetical protein
MCILIHTACLVFLVECINRLVTCNKLRFSRIKCSTVSCKVLVSSWVRLAFFEEVVKLDVYFSFAF